MQLTRCGDEAIVDAASHPSIGTNIQGPSVIHAPPWVDHPLGRYYLYFADHKGSYIRLAYADAIDGPWTVHEPGTLHLAESCFLTSPPPATNEELGSLRQVYEEVLGDTYLADDLVVDATTPHIASPDVHLDHERQQVVMYFHGLDALAVQVTRVALSGDGLTFVARPEVLCGPYLRTFAYDAMTYGMTMPGHLCRSPDGLSAFEPGPTLFEPTMRHFALWPHDGVLDVFWTRVGDRPESVLWSRIPLHGDWSRWAVESEDVLLLTPELAWEGAQEPLEPSRRGAVHQRVNQLRDPAVFHDGDRTYLFYAGGGESGIGVAELAL